MADILVVDDDSNLGIALQLALEEMGHACRYADSARSGWEDFQRRVPDLALLDLRLPGSNGLDLMAQMRARRANLPIVIMTAFGTVTTAVAALKSGAADFIEKPLSIHEVCRLVTDMLVEARATGGVPIDAGEEESDPKPSLVGESPPMLQVLSLAARIAALPDPPAMGLNATLICGETGTGKELLARYIHDRSARRNRPFVQVNCSAIPENLFETELFGHERGSFTDAKATKKGLLEAAHGGVLFLDEIADIPMSMQGKLLIVIETGRFRRIGSTTEQSVDIRITAATNRDLDERTRAGQFRADLYHRLKIFYIEMPPLRDRDNDIILLARHFSDRFSRRLGRPVPQISDACWKALLGHSWPGNVRELAHVLLRAMVASDDGMLEPNHLGLSKNPGAGAPASLTGVDVTGMDWTLRAVEKRLLSSALERAGGNITEGARLLQMPRGTFRYRLERLGLLPASTDKVPADGSDPQA